MEKRIEETKESPNEPVEEKEKIEEKEPEDVKIWKVINWCIIDEYAW